MRLRKKYQILYQFIYCPSACNCLDCHRRFRKTFEQAFKRELSLKARWDAFEMKGWHGALLGFLFIPLGLTFAMAGQWLVNLVGGGPSLFSLTMVVSAGIGWVFTMLVKR